MNAVFLISLFFVSIPSVISTSQICQFNQSVITWRIDKFSRTSNLSNADVTQVIINATDTWADVIPVDFQQSFNASENVDLSLRFLDSAYDDIDGQNLLAVDLGGCFGTRPTRISSNANVKFAIGNDRADVSELPDWNTIPKPPSFMHDPNPPIIYFWVYPANFSDLVNEYTVKEKRLICSADGYPKPTCKWLKDSVPLDIEGSNSSITQQEGYGTITMNQLKESDKGTYQCYCQNGNGTAYARPIQLKQAYMDFFPTPKLEIVPVEMGKPFSRSCTAPASVPPARVSWILRGPSVPGGTAIANINCSHIATNDKGDIFFQYVMKEDDDFPSNLFFTCYAENMELYDIKFGDQFKIKVVKSRSARFPPYIEPKEQYVSPREITVLRGKSFELFCIFSGFPDQIPIWRRIDGGRIDWQRVKWGINLGANFNKSLRVVDVGFQDEGTYQCRFSGDLNNQRTRNFSVNVKSAPYWVSPPQSVNSSEGETAQFDCDATGRPKPTFTFYKNGKELKGDNQHFFIEGSKLRIVDLRIGENGEGDNAAYQCKAENKYGLVWGNFYLNLLSFRPLLLDGPSDVVTVLGRDITFSCRFFGSPRPEVFWNTPRSLTSLKVEADLNGVTRLRLSDVKEDDEGFYECYAKNKHGNATGRGYLTVRSEINNLFTVALRMIGKALGLRGDSTDPNSLMSSGYNGRFANLSNDIVQEIQALYGVRNRENTTQP